VGGLLIPGKGIALEILMIRRHKVMLDADLADLYGVTTTKHLNEQVKRNPERCPADFMFQLTEEEKTQVATIVTTSNASSFGLCHAFTNEGANTAQ
jgi:hypothetical protein